MLVIGVMASLADEKYTLQAMACNETWVKEAESLSIPVVFFCGNVEERYFFTPSNVKFHHFPIKDDYTSATLKTWFGFRHLLKYKADYYLIAGTDNYIEVKRTLERLKRYNPNVPSLIGGYAQTRTMEREIMFPTGGGGMILTRAALEDLSPRIEYYLETWKNKCIEYDLKLLPACDVSLADAAWDRGYSVIIDKYFYPCSWRGIIKVPYRKDFLPVDTDKLCVHHYLDEGEMLFYHSFKQHAKLYLEMEEKYGECFPFPYTKIYVNGSHELYLYLLVKENITTFKSRELYVNELKEELVSLGEKFAVKVKLYKGEEVEYSH